ncbi:MAG: tetratricopeptide repeat protein [Deltaproteobacteria bacterium]|nr:tetratricopeptide repeat protein [Deltaproteobacteria bacterium]
MDKTKYFAAAEKAVLKGQNEKALEALEIILKSDPQDLKALNRAADIHLKLSNNEKALDYLKRVGNVYTKDGFYSKAVAIYKRILKVDQAAPKAALIEIHEKLADLYGQLGLVSDAMSHFSIVVDFYDQTGEQEALLRILKKVSDLDPFNIESQLKLASLFLAEKKPAEAIETLRRLDENILARGHMPDIVRVHERWVELFPQEIAQLQYLVDLYLKANEPKKALARIQISFKADPKNPEVLELLSSTFIAMKQPDKARAVDTELLKIYRQAGTAEKAFATEERLKNKAGVSSVTAAPSSAASSTASANPYTTGTATKKVNLNAGASEEVIDSAEFLIRELQLDPEEKKVISECDVYLKYGLAEKAFEVLRNNLGKFPQSIALRWKLKIAANELDKSEDLKHILSEIVLLATTLKLDAWIKLSTDELIALDPQHPSVKGKGGAKTVASSAQAAAPKKAASPAPSKEKAEEVLKDFEASEISIIVEDELSLVSEVSDISIKDLQPEVKSDPSQEPTVKRKPEEMSAPVELNNDFESSSEEFSLDSGNSEASQVLELELNEVESDSSVEEEVNPETILSDADFTDDELQFLNSPMESEATVTAAAKPASASAASTAGE